MKKPQIHKHDPRAAELKPAKARMLSVPRHYIKAAQTPPPVCYPHHKPKQPEKHGKAKSLAKRDNSGFYEGITLQEYLMRGPQISELHNERDQLFFNEEEEFVEEETTRGEQSSKSGRRQELKLPLINALQKKGLEVTLRDKARLLALTEKQSNN